MTFPEPNGAEPHSSEPSGNGLQGIDPTGSAGGASPPLPLVLSCLAGVVGTVLLVAGAVAGRTGLSIAGVVAGSLSLVAALYWRSLLISSYAARKQGRRPG